MGSITRDGNALATAFFPSSVFFAALLVVTLLERVFASSV